MKMAKLTLVKLSTRSYFFFFFAAVAIVVQIFFPCKLYEGVKAATKWPSARANN